MWNESVAEGSVDAIRSIDRNGVVTTHATGPAVRRYYWFNDTVGYFREDSGLNRSRLFRQRLGTSDAVEIFETYGLGRFVIGETAIVFIQGGASGEVMDNVMRVGLDGSGLQRIRLTPGPTFDESAIGRGFAWIERAPHARPGPPRLFAVADGF